MATNPPAGDGHRNGAVQDRSQVFNPVTQRGPKRDTDTGRFMDQKVNGKPYAPLKAAWRRDRVSERSRWGQTGGKAWSLHRQVLMHYRSRNNCNSSRLSMVRPSSPMH